MKGFLEWFKSSTKMKRWMFMIVIGIVLSCYGFAQILVMQELSFGDLAKIIAIFVVGFTCVIIGLVYIQKRTLELLIEANDESMQNNKKANLDIKTLIFNKKVYENGPNIVVIGGGNGLNMMLQGLKKYTSNLTAIVTISDYGKNPSKSRTELGLLPLEDVKQSLVALSGNEQLMNQLMEYQFSKGNLKELKFGDIFLSAMNQISGDFTKGIEDVQEIFNITGKVLPVTLDEMQICAELQDGTIVKEKDKIPEVVSDKVTKINRIYVTPSNCRPAPGVIEAIKEADAIVIGPGSLYTNVIPNLLIKNVAKTIKESKAMKFYVSNIMTEPGQTDNYSVSDHINAIIEHAGEGIIDFCLCDTGEIVPEFIRKYNKQGSDLVEPDLQKSKQKGVNLVQRDMSTIVGEYIRHNPDVIASTIVELICNDLKFKDKQNDTQYVLLNTKLKDEKNKEKKENKIAKKKQPKKQEKPREANRKKSKFNSKYKERIEAIQNSEEKRMENRRLLEKAERLENEAVEKQKFLEEMYHVDDKEK